MQLRARVFFDDNTRFDDVTELSWISWSLLIAFSSPLSDVISVSGRTATLKENYWKTVNIKVQALCPSGAITLRPSTLLGVAANLDPQLGDVDLGSRYGLQFPARVKGETLSVDIRVNSFNAKLVNFQIVMRFDSTEVRATACEAGPLNISTHFSAQPEPFCHRFVTQSPKTTQLNQTTQLKPTKPLN